jgi:hypothetical protein
MTITTPTMEPVPPLPVTIADNNIDDDDDIDNDDLSSAVLRDLSHVLQRQI